MDPHPAMTPHAFTDAERTLLRALIDRIVPEDGDPGALALGADRYVFAQLEGPLVADRALIAAGLAALPGDFIATDDALLALEHEPWFARLVELTQEGVYADPGNGGNADAASWRMIGYEHRVPQGPTGPAPNPPQPPRTLGPSDVTDYDVIVIGAGAAGGVMACRLAEAGKTVLLLERWRELSYAHDGHRDHLRNHRLAQYGHNTGPALEGNPRVFVDQAGTEHIVPPHHGDYHHNAAGVGSGTFLYGAQGWRFHPDDFRMASRYGVPDGSSLVDWPIGYDDLAPYYEWVEWNVGVAGDPDPHGGSRARGYPMPPVPQRLRHELLRRGAEALGISTFIPPLLINTQAYNGRAACIECGACVGFGCPSNAKNGTQNTMIPRALATGRVTLITGATAERIELDAGGRATGVTYWADSADAPPVRRTVHARAVVSSGGAIESARLLLLSGIENDNLGRNLQGHYYPTMFGRFEEPVHDSRGPGIAIATTAFTHGNDGVIGGAMLADEFVMTPVILFKQALPPGVRRWGLEAKDYMRRDSRHITKITGPVHEIPSPTARVSLADVTDRLGLRVAKLSGTTHPETVRTADYIGARAEEWLRASGAVETWGQPSRLRLSAGQHQAGTCRMGRDPAASVTDVYGRVWGHDNLFVSDGGLHPTNGAFNPVLTIMAMAARNAEHIAGTI